MTDALAPACSAATRANWTSAAVSLENVLITTTTGTPNILTVDLHSLRHTFGTMLSRGGVAPRTAQAAMRHSTIDLTRKSYTDPRLLNVVGALEALPGLGLGSKAKAEVQAGG